MTEFQSGDWVRESGNGVQYVQRSKVKIPTLTSQNKIEVGNGLFPRR